MASTSTWPALPRDPWRDTQATLHRCLQVIGKIQLGGTPLVNHFWNAAFRLTARGLATAPIPHGDGTFTVDMDFLDHEVIIRTSEGATRALAFAPRTVADFYREVTSILGSLGIPARIWDHPVELLEEAIPFHEDTQHRAYEPEPVGRWWEVVRRSAVVFEEFRARFIGKCSPVHFWWGSFDLAVSRFNGKPAPARPGAGVIDREAYSHETSSVGFWPGDKRTAAAAYFAYTAPPPAGIGGPGWNPELGLFLLPYEDVRKAASPRQAILDFAEACYQKSGWDPALTRSPPSGRR